MTLIKDCHHFFATYPQHAGSDSYGRQGGKFGDYPGSLSYVDADAFQTVGRQEIHNFAICFELGPTTSSSSPGSLPALYKVSPLDSFQKTYQDLGLPLLPTLFDLPLNMSQQITAKKQQGL